MSCPIVAGAAAMVSQPEGRSGALRSRPGWNFSFVGGMNELSSRSADAASEAEALARKNVVLDYPFLCD